MKYTAKRATAVEAWIASDLIIAAATNWATLPPPIAQGYDRGGWIFFHNRIIVPTTEGSRDAQRSDMVVMTGPGEFAVCKADAFAANYEPAE